MYAVEVVVGIKIRIERDQSTMLMLVTLRYDSSIRAATSIFYTAEIENA